MVTVATIYQQLQLHLSITCTSAYYADWPPFRLLSFECCGWSTWCCVKPLVFSILIYRPGSQTSSSDSNSTYKHCSNWVIGETVYEIAQWHSCTFHNAGGLNSANFPHSWPLSVVFLLHSCQKLHCTRSSAPRLFLCGTIDLLTDYYIITQLSHLVGMSIQNTKQFQERKKLSLLHLVN